MKGFIFPPDFTSRKLLRSWTKHYVVRKGRRTQQSRILLDTFDGRLFRRGYLLLKSGGTFALTAVAKADGELHHICATRKTIRFSRDLPAGILKNKLGPITENRALLAKARWQEEQFGVVVLNRRKQILARGQLVEFHFGKRRLLLLTFTGERGQSRPLQELFRLIKEWGGAEFNRSPFLQLLNLLQIKLDVYAPKRTLRLHPQWPVYRSLSVILKHQLAVMKQNERGVRQDWDVEFLHDFRVALRRTRSLFSQFKKAFPQMILQKAQTDLSRLSEQTNHLRDLDVQLSRRALYGKLLPAALHPGLEKLYKAIARERQQELAIVLKALNGVIWRRIKKEWPTLLASEASASWSNQAMAAMPTKTLVCRLVMKKFKQMQKMEQEDWRTAADETLHRLRIEGKKLRYLLEFFASLFPWHELNQILEELKNLQDHLGRLNDLAVQQEKLLSHLKPDTPRLHHPQTTAAIGALVAVLHQEQTQLRDSLPAALERFFDSEHKKLYKKISSV